MPSVGSSPLEVTGLPPCWRRVTRAGSDRAVSLVRLSALGDARELVLVRDRGRGRELGEQLASRSLAAAHGAFPALRPAGVGPCASHRHACSAGSGPRPEPPRTRQLRDRATALP